MTGSVLVADDPDRLAAHQHRAQDALAVLLPLERRRLPGMPVEKQLAEWRLHRRNLHRRADVERDRPREFAGALGFMTLTSRPSQGSTHSRPMYSLSRID
jgi:hypothetical protein